MTILIPIRCETRARHCERLYCTSLPLSLYQESAIKTKGRTRPAEGSNVPAPRIPDRTIEESARLYEERFGADADAVAITLAVRRINTIMVTSIGRFLDSLGLGVSLSGARLTVLRGIYFGEGHQIGLNELWQQLQVSRTNVTNLIDSLERDGLVERTINASDRRVIDARLTPKGVELCEIALPQIGAYMEGLCRNFSAPELQRFGKYLARFQEELLLRVSASPPED